MQKKKEEHGQAALEFLTTYGWALLVLLVVIAALSSFGIISPSNFLPERCTVTTGFDCVDYRLTKYSPTGTVGEVEFVLRNSLGKSVTILGYTRNVSCPSCEEGWRYCTDDNAVAACGGNPVTCMQQCSVINWDFATSTYDALGAQQYVVAAGETFSWTTGNGGSHQIHFRQAGAKDKVQFQFQYVEVDGLYPHKVEGEIFANVQNQ